MMEETSILECTGSGENAPFFMWFSVRHSLTTMIGYRAAEFQRRTQVGRPRVYIHCFTTSISLV